MAKSALITGAAGQDGGYLIDLLRARHYTIHALSRHPSTAASECTDIIWHQGAVTDPLFLERLIDLAAPDEIYNLAAISRPALSWQIPFETTRLNAVVPQMICETVLKSNASCRIFQASSCEIFGSTSESLQNEMTPCRPVTPYGISKFFAHQMIGVYRNRFGLHASCGILFNHESPRRPLTFVSQKIAHAAAAISLGVTTTRELDERGQPIVEDGRLKLGSIHIRRDFGFAGDVAEAMYLMLRSDVPDDYVIGTGQNHSIAQFCETAFNCVGLDWRDHVSKDEELVREADLDLTRADATKLMKKFDWKPKASFEQLVAMMVEARLEKLTSAAQQ